MSTVQFSSPKARRGARRPGSASNHGHSVRFFEKLDTIFGAVGRFIEECLRAGDAGIIVGTPENIIGVG
jgi:hypothetical protein